MWGDKTLDKASTIFLSLCGGEFRRYKSASVRADGGDGGGGGGERGMPKMSEKREGDREMEEGKGSVENGEVVQSWK